MSGALAIIGYDYDLDEMEKDVPLCSMEEFRRRIQNREDIFQVDKDKFLRNIQALCVALAIASGIWLSHVKLLDSVIPDMYPDMPKVQPPKEGIVRTIEIDRADLMPKPKAVERPKQLTTNKRRRVNGDGKRRGGGDHRARTYKNKGVLGIMAGLVKGVEVAFSDPLANGGFAKDVDAILLGTGSLRKGSNSGTGRRGEAAIGFGPGSDGGFGEGTGGVGDLIDAMMTPDNVAIDLKPSTPDINLKPVEFTGRTLVGGRSRASIMRVVQTNITSLRHAYNRRLREVPNLKGKVKIKFAIDEFGKVIFCEVVNSSMGDVQLEKILVSKIKHWVFEKIDRPGDVTEIIYPFVFSM